MFCRNCGQEVNENAAVCLHCGALIKEELIKEERESVKEQNGMAVAGFVCSFFIPLLGWIFGGIGLNRASKRNGKGKGFSIAAITIATVGFIINLALL